MSEYTARTGDMIQVNRGGYNHVGIYIGLSWNGQDVIHNAKGGCVAFTTFAEFAKGVPVILRRAAPDNYFAQQDIVQRATSLLGQKYDLIKFNCEHFATYAQMGRAQSPQLAGLALLGLAGLFLAAVSLRRV